MAKVLMIDPPSGWLYGFPKVIPEGAKIAEFYLKHGYPKDEIDFAVRWSRMWEVDDDGHEQAGTEGQAAGTSQEPYSERPANSEIPTTSDSIQETLPWDD